MKKIIFCLIIPITLLVIFSSSLYAASFTIKNGKAQLTGINDEYSVDLTASISTTSGTQYYLRGVFYKENSKNYCGYTWNGKSWFNGPYTDSGWKNLLAITINSSSWSGQLKAKIDPDDSGCTESGNYKFKVQRFTVGGSSNFDTQEEQSLVVIIPTAVPSPLPTKAPSAAPTSGNSPTTSPPTKIITPTVQVVKVTTSQMIKPKSSLNIKPTESSSSGVLGASISGNMKPSISPVDSIKLERKNLDNKFLASSTKKLPVFFMILGIFLLIAVCGILLYKNYKIREDE